MSDQYVLSLRGIAALAGVQRPVVSVWRSRSAESDTPFPPTVDRRGQVELFDADDVVSWLEATGRGNNPEARADVMVHAQPADLQSTEVAEAQEALLCLLRLTPHRLLEVTVDELLDLADEVDPDDEFLFSEVARLGDRAPAVARYLNRLVDASYGFSGALTVLDDRLAQESRSSVRMAAEATSLLGEVVAAVALDIGAAAVTVEDVGGQGMEMVAAGVSALRERLEVDVEVSGGDGAARSARRRCIIARGSAATGPGAHKLVIANLHSADGRVNVGRVLDAIDNLQLERTDADRVLIVGPALALCDDLPSDGEKQRAEVLRLGRVRLVAKLPAGLIVHHPRQRLGLWVLGPEGAVRDADRRAMMTADLSDTALSPAVASHLATDAVAALESRQGLHAFTFAKHRALREVLADRGPIVLPGARPARVAANDALDILEVEALLRRAGTGRVTLDSTQGPRGRHVTVGEALEASSLVLVPGVRLSAEPLGEGSLRLITPAVVLGDRPPLRVDPLASGVAGCRRTEPGDVVFVTSPRPRAMVDHDGLSVVAYPARVLRPVDGQGLVAEAIANAINVLAHGAREWRGWSLPQVAPGAADDLSAALTHLADEEDKMRERCAAVSAVRSRLADVVAAGAAKVSLQIDEDHDNNDVHHSAERRWVS